MDSGGSKFCDFSPNSAVCQNMFAAEVEVTMVLSLKQ